MTMIALSFPRKRESISLLVSTAGFSLDARLRGHDGSIRLRGHDDEDGVIPAKAGIHYTACVHGGVFTGCPPARA
jgi:hypothetical protein